MRTSIGCSLLSVGLIACAADSAQPPPIGDTAGTTHGTVSRPTSGDDEPFAAAAGAPSAPPATVVEGLSITGIAVFQGVKVELLDDGKWVAARNAPVVAGRPALVRVYVAPQAGWSPRPVTGELRLVGRANQASVLRDVRTISAASRDDLEGSTFDFEVPGEALAGDTALQVALTGAGAVPVAGESDARYPRDGSAKPLEARATGSLKIVVVPVRYDADGSGRLPDVSPAQLERYQQVFMSRYPASEVLVSLRAPLPWKTAIGRTGAGFSAVLRALIDLRQQDRVASDVYYYGALAPAPTLAQYCPGGCVAGLSTVVEDREASLLRASVGLGYTGEESASTAAHELGHAHGREHAPCGGAARVDPSFPYTSGGIGVWGYDILSKTFTSPTHGKDMMGYCKSEWVSDYTFAALFERMSAISKPTTTTGSGATGGSFGTIAAAGALGASGAGTYRLATVEPDGALGDASELELDMEPSGGVAREATFTTASGAALATVTARFYPFDHLPGGLVLVPARHATSAWRAVKVDGFSGALAR